MIRAILGGQKTMTRRIVKPQPPPMVDGVEGQHEFPSGRPFWRWKSPGRLSAGIFCPHGEPGDRLWVRETFAGDVPGCGEQGGVSYRADHNDPRGDGPANPMRWTPAIHMPRALSRIALEITGVRVERLQDITAAAVHAEGLDVPLRPGVDVDIDGDLWPEGVRVVRTAFAVLWDKINGDRASWASNPWVWVVSFKRVRP
jgi:hypothetical protein